MAYPLSPSLYSSSGGLSEGSITNPSTSSSRFRALQGPSYPSPTTRFLPHVSLLPRVEYQVHCLGTTWTLLSRQGQCENTRKRICDLPAILYHAKIMSSDRVENAVRQTYFRLEYSVRLEASFPSFSRRLGT